MNCRANYTARAVRGAECVTSNFNRINESNYRYWNVSENHRGSNGFCGSNQSDGDTIYRLIGRWRDESRSNNSQVTRLFEDSPTVCARSTFD